MSMLSISRRRFLGLHLQAWIASSFIPTWSAELMAIAENPLVPALPTFQARKQWLLDMVAADPVKYGYLSFYAAQACFIKGKIDDGSRMANASLAELPRARVREVEMFNLWPALHCFLRWRQYIDPANEKILRDLLGGTTYYKDARTSNLSTLAKVIRYLGGVAWGEGAFVPGAAYRPNDPSAEKSLHEHLTNVCRGGFGEYASWPYFKYNLMPILSLAELSPDPEMKRRAQMAFEAGLAQCVSTWLKGVWGLATGRSYPDMLSMNPWGSVATLWVYFGGIVTPRISAEAMMPAVMQYDLDPILENAATDRANPYTAWSHFGDPEQISYVNRSYVLFSEAQFQAKPRDFAQSYPYGVMWIEPDVTKNNFLWLTVPVNDSKAGLVDAVTVSHPHGILARAQSNIQHEGALLYVCDTTSAPFKYALCYVPGGWLAVRNDARETGRICIHYGNVLIAITSSQPFTWDLAAGIQAPAAKPHPADSEFRIAGQRFAAAVETASPEEFSGANPAERLKSFQEAIENRTKLVLEEGDHLKATYTTRAGVVISRVFNGDAVIDGHSVDPEKWPMLESPWINQRSREANLSISDGQRTRIYDFKQWQVTDT